MNIIFVAVMSLFLSLQAKAVSVNAPSPSPDLLIRVCVMDYFNSYKQPSCQTRQFLERRGNDFVYLIQKDGESERKELILDSSLSSKVRPYSPATYVPHSYMLQFPMEVGKKWEGSYVQTGNNRSENRIRFGQVKDYGSITIKAGTFQAFHVLAHTQLDARRSVVESYFYCPDLAMICRYESRDFGLREEIVKVTRIQRK